MPKPAATGQGRAGTALADGRIRVVLDPGHGGIDPGAQVGGISEAAVMLGFAHELSAALRNLRRFSLRKPLPELIADVEEAFGIRIENLVVVEPAQSPDGREMLGFETLTLVPIDTRLVDLDAGILSAGDIAWLDAYHARVAETLGPVLPEDDRAWLAEKCAPIAG